MVGRGSNEEEGKRVIDSSVGGLVWVRRKNGSWWPGQIIGLDEVSENGDGSPKSGTPIKLLGRDDSCVEWYDIETTKAVKAFRCGEYDTCIEKAKLTAPKFLKRSLKYPRREIGIYYALQIENAVKDALNSNSGDNSDKDDRANCENGCASTTRPVEDSKSSSEETSSENSNSTRELSHPPISYGKTNGLTFLESQPSKGKRRKTPYDSEDDGHEGFKRMKGLKDLGVNGSDPKRIHVLALTNPALRSSISINGNHSTNSKTVPTLENGGGGVTTYKKKRSQVVHIHELLKRKCQRPPMTKVLENTTMVPVRIICDEFANPFERSDVIPPFCESENGTKVKDTQFLNHHLPEADSSYTLFDVPFSDEEFHLSDFPPVWQPTSPLKACVGALKGDSNHNIHIEAPSLEYEALDEPGQSYCSSNGSLKVEKSTSEWQSKGKRKTRFITKNDETISSPWQLEVTDNNSDVYSMTLENSSQISPNSNGIVNGFTDRTEYMSLSTSSQRPFTYNKPQLLGQLSSELPEVPSLYEVEVIVEATRHQAQHVPYISLMSKLSGKPITGHPLTVEALQDGSCDPHTMDFPPSGTSELENEDPKLDFKIEPKARKAKHIKLRPNLSHRRGKSSRRKVKGRGKGKSSRRKSKGRGKSSKSKKRRGSSSSKKTRKLSSLTVTGLNKSVMQSSNGPTLACVPLKIVFSRITEALNGSNRSAHRAVTLNTS